MLVCGNTGAMVGDSWMGEHFVVTGDRSVHFGLFDCAPIAASEGAEGGACC